ncbi:serine/threonine-protein kinase [Nakamurella lactea]|uniref:serine/threonine-protein kinase n=1 Tax=Nakamurella lactea TaxID=459515 RepID=UPI000424F551|nr:serine/threonine-protein kinase [Nakamurella lactea]
MESAPTRRPATDVVAGRYALCDPIDSGGSGTVWRAWDLARGRYCAAKLLRRRDAGQLLRFVREQAVRLEGTHIASPYAWAAEDADVLIATELVDGGSLHAMVNRSGPLAEPTVAVLLDQLLAGLQQVHGAGLVHRDIKPGNVLLRATGTTPLRLLLIDFGLAIRADDARLTELGMVIGTPGYLPPELATGAGPSAAQDLFAAGRTAVAALTAIEPKIRVRQEFRTADPVLGRLLAALLAEDPDQRPPDATTARRLLSAAAMDPHPRTMAGAAITLGPVLPPLPDGWDPVHGPTSAARMTPARLAVDHRPRGATIIDTGIAVAPPAARPMTPPARTPRRPSRWPVLAGGLGIAMALAAIVAAVVIGQNPPPPNGSEDATGTGTRTVQSSGAATDPNGPSAGDECGWTDEGDEAAGPGGSVTCVLGADGSYHWQ